jgi:prefoldin alpha subunit
MTEEEKQQKEQELMFKFQMFEQQAQQIQQQLQAIEHALVEMNSLNFGLDELVGSKDKEIMAPIGRGIFVKAKLLSEKLTVDIGGKNFVKKSVGDTKKLIEEQIKKLEDVKGDLNENLEMLSKELEKEMYG